LLALAVMAGCAGDSKKHLTDITPLQVVPVPRTPPFLDGPMALLLTNSPGYTAHIELEGQSELLQRLVVTGTLMGQNGKLFFAPDPDPNVKKQALRREDTSFLWDTAEGHGVLLSGPMQSYAPISSSRTYSKVVWAPLAGHDAKSFEVTVTAGDGSETVLRVQSPGGSNGLPTRITSTNLPPTVMTLSHVRLKNPPADAFAPPSDYTKYSSAEEMMNEMAMREHNLNRKRGYEPPPSDVIGIPPSSQDPRSMDANRGL
jgi:hypothetical protein